MWTKYSLREWNELLEWTKSDTLSFADEKKWPLVDDLIFLKQLGGDPIEILQWIIRKFTSTPLVEVSTWLNRPWKSLKKINLVP